MCPYNLMSSQDPPVVQGSKVKAKKSIAGLFRYSDIGP